MEYQKMLDKTPNQSFKFRKKTWLKKKWFMWNV